MNNDALTNLPLPSRLQIGDFVLDREAVTLVDAQGRHLPLRAQAWAVLNFLADHVGQLVSKDELLAAVWPGLIVTDDSLVQCVKEIRRALCDDERRLIRTENRRGYRLDVAVPTRLPALVIPDVSQFQQSVRFARTSDGVSIAYGVSGAGYPVVRTAHWMTHLDWDWRSDSFGPRIRAMSSAFRFVRYDGRGWGLSDRNFGTGLLDEWVRDLEAVVDAERLDRFALFGPSGGAFAAMRYAALHPDRVSHLILLGGLARGSLHRGPQSMSRTSLAAFTRLIEEGWGQDNAAFRQLITSMMWPTATAQQMQSFNLLQREASTAASAAAMLEAQSDTQVLDDLPQIRCPTLVLHSLHDARVPFEEGRLLAARIPGARLEPFDSPNHTPLLGEPDFERLHHLIVDFVANT